METVIYKKPELEDKELISSYFRRHTSRSCERTFVNVYLWARFYDTRYAVIENALVFQSRDEEGKPCYAYPAGEPEHVKKALEVLRQNCREEGNPFVLYNVTPDNFAQMEGWFPDMYQIEYDRDQADYVYEREKLATLSGKKLHGKRNHINQFMAKFTDWKYEPITEENLEECFQMALRWRTENGCDEDEEKNAEMCVTLNSLRLFKELELTGGVLRVNGEIVAFTLGEELCEDTFVVHIEKAFSWVDGAYPMINQQFVQHACEKYRYVNREEDTGAEGLRKAKLSYRPVFLVEKGTVTEKEQERG